MRIGLCPCRYGLSTIMPTFVPDRSKLNAKFEGYKLDPIAQDDVISRYDLPQKIGQSTISAGKSPLTMPEVQSRITHNHLTVSPEGEYALYVDADSRVILIKIDEVSLFTLSNAYRTHVWCKVDNAPTIFPHGV